MSNAELQCVRCLQRYPLSPQFFGCVVCAGQGRLSPLEVQYVGLPSRLERSASPGIWAWSDWLPALSPSYQTTLGEGRTPLLPFKAPKLGRSLWIKNETVNPTWSWKDRPNSISISVARSMGYRKVLAISTGNHGSAMAAYGARAGLKGLVFCHQDVPPLQLALMRGYGAEVVLGGDRDRMAMAKIREGGYFPATIYCPRSGFANPYGVEGFKTIALEIVEELGRAPDRVYVPVGSGDGIYGIWKGFREMKAAGVIERVPRMIGCQSTGADSAFRAFQKGTSQVEALESTSTIALSIDELVTGNHAVRAAVQSSGKFLAVRDEVILNASRWIAGQGLAIEAASSAALACALDPAEEQGEECWVVIASGAAVKWPDQVRQGLGALEV